MKLFVRTLLFFIGIVIIQSTLTIFLVTGNVTRNNESDARLELKIEASAVYENYNSWVRIMWKTIIRIDKDEKFKKPIENYQTISPGDDIGNWFDEILLLSGMDFVILRDEHGINFEYSSSEIDHIPFNKLGELKSSRNHPYLELREIDGTVYLVGILKHEGSSSMELYLLKQIDENFYKRLPLQERSVVILTSYSTMKSVHFLDEDIFDNYIDAKILDIPYKEIYNIELEEGSYNAAFRKLGKLQKNNGEEEFFLILLLSNEPFLSILSSINKTLLIVSFIVGLFTIILSFFFSGKITQPISKLIAAMEGIRKGNYNVKIAHNSGNEVGKLFQGFNEMTLQLNQNKKSMESFIHEITFLKDYNEKIIYSLRAGILILDSNLVIEKVNGFFLECFYKVESDILGKNIEDISIDVIDRSIIINIKDIIIGNKNSQSAIRRIDSLVYEIKLYPLFAISNTEDRKCVLEIDDVSRKYELEGKIFQAEKLASLSMLSAGVSHEINNPLSSILTNVQNLLAEEHNEETGIALNWIEQETRRIARIVSELLDFSASRPDGDEGVEVNACITEVIKLINYGLEKENRIEIISEFQDNLSLAIISNSELKQVIINLVQNSIYAIEGSGKIYIKTNQIENNHKLNIQVQDTGTGLDKDVMGHIFDPFFTTKENGKGTGLGLSIVYGIINKNSGSIDVKSKKGIGTTFILTIPVCENVK